MTAKKVTNVGNTMLAVSENTHMVIGSSEPVVMVPSLEKFWESLDNNNIYKFTDMFPSSDIFKKYLKILIDNGEDLDNVFITIGDWVDDEGGMDDNEPISNDLDYEDYADIVEKNFDRM